MSIAGKTFCITGKIDYPGGRAALQQYITANGGFNTSSVTRDVDYLITSDPHSGSLKNKAAQALGCTPISETEFFKMIEGGEDS